MRRENRAGCATQQMLSRGTGEQRAEPHMFIGAHHQHARRHSSGFRQKRFHRMGANNGQRLRRHIMALQKTRRRAGKCGGFFLILSDTQHGGAVAPKTQQREKLHGTHRPW